MTQSRIDAITGLRGFAALLVLYAHLAERCWLIPNPHFLGEVGVAIFFSLSGFLLSYLYMEQRFSRHSVDAYLTARFARIAPAYLFVVLASFTICKLIDPEFVYAISNDNVVRHLLFSGNVSIFWSIAPEVQFYALFILLWAVRDRLFMRSDIVGMTLLALFFIEFLCFRDGFPGTFVGSKLHYFAFGVIAGTLRARVDPTKQNLASLCVLQLLLIALMLAVQFNFIAFPFSAKIDFYHSIPSAMLSSLFVFSFSLPSPIGAWLFENRAMTYCGEWSFSIYLINMAIIYFFLRWVPGLNIYLITVGIVAVVFALSWAMNRAIEKPGARAIRGLGGRIAKLFFSQPTSKTAEPTLPA